MHCLWGFAGIVFETVDKKLFDFTSENYLGEDGARGSSE